MLDADQLDSFAAAFATLAALHLSPPDGVVLDTVRSLAPEWPLGTDGESTPGVSALLRSAEAGEDAAAVVRDHDRLYGDSAAAVIPPFESVHRGLDGLVFDQETLRVRDAYRQLGLQAPHLNREPDDHIGLELEFLGQICLRTLDALDEGDDAAAQDALHHATDFLEDHLQHWAPDFLGRVSQEADTEFMRGLAQLTAAALVQFGAALGTTGPAEDATTED